MAYSRSGRLLESMAVMCIETSGSCPACAARRLLEQQRQERALGLPQQRQAGRAQRQCWLPVCSELIGCSGMDFPGVEDQMSHPGPAPWRRGPNPQAPGVLVGGVDARQTLPGPPPRLVATP